MRFSGKTIVLGVTGSIAAYKALELCRQLVKHGADVQVILSEGAKNFIQPLSFQAFSGKAVLENQFSTNAPRGMKHIDLTNADALIIAPATANIVAKAAAGLADDLLTSTLEAFSGPVLIAPAMNDVMYQHQVQRHNIRRLAELGYHVIEPDSGDLACGRKGQGRLASAGKILSQLERQFKPQDFEGKTVLITAGPTREYLDPVRFISNASSGKMGFALAEAAQSRGAKVMLVSGPSALAPPDQVKVTLVETTKQMEDAVRKNFSKADVFVSAAAPADFGPKTFSKTKLKKRIIKAIHLSSTPDILAWAGHHKKPHQFVLGFALETNTNVSKSRKKMKDKKADALLVNSVRNAGSDLAEGIWIDEHFVQKISRQPKLSFAHQLLERIVKHDGPGKKKHE